MANPAAVWRAGQPKPGMPFVPPAGGGGGSFQEWWAKDDTQARIGGFFDGMGAIFGGLAGIPLGGGDMSSMERAAVRAAKAPGEARKRIKKRRFGQYIQNQLQNETDPHRRDMLQAAIANPKQAGYFLAMESPTSKEERAKRIADYEHQHRMELEGVKARNASSARAGLTAKQISDVGRAESWWYGLPEQTRKDYRAGVLTVEELMVPEFSKNVTLLHTPHYGLFWREQQKGIHSGGYTTVPRENLAGTQTVTDPETGEKYEVRKVDVAEEILADGNLDPESEARMEYQIAKQRQEDDEASAGKVDEVGQSLGLSPYEQEHGVVGLTDEQTMRNLEGADYTYTEPGANEVAEPVEPAPAAAPSTVEAGLSVSPGSESAESGDTGGFWNWLDQPNQGMQYTDPRTGETRQTGRWAGPGEMVRSLITSITDNPNPYPEQKPVSESWAEFKGLIGDAYQGDLSLSHALENRKEALTFIGPIDERRMWRNRGPSMPERKPAGVAVDTGPYLEEKRRRSQVIDKRLRREAAERRRRGF